jgi:hypothetical protein
MLTRGLAEANMVRVVDARASKVQGYLKAVTRGKSAHPSGGWQAQPS